MITSVFPTKLYNDKQLKRLAFSFLVVAIFGLGTHETALGADKIISWDAPTYHDFGLVGVGLGDTLVVYITNTGDEEFVISFSIPDTSQSFVRGPGNMIARPGETRSVPVAFRPVVPGNHSIYLDLGDVVPPVLLEGEGYPRPMEFSAGPDSIDFGWEFLGDGSYGAVFIYNTGGTFLELDVHLADEDLGFSLTRGEGFLQLPPGTEHLIHIEFMPGKSWVRHDEHFHVDFAIPCKPL